MGRLGAEESSLRTQVLSKDFDLTHTRFLKAILDDKVQDMDRLIEAHEEMVSCEVSLLESEDPPL